MPSNNFKPNDPQNGATYNTRTGVAGLPHLDLEGDRVDVMTPTAKTTQTKPAQATMDTPAVFATTAAAPPSGLAVTLDVEPRKPRLAWQGMDRREGAVSVPTQVVEIVRPGKASASDDKLPGLLTARQTARAQELPPNRLIWTNDNIVALHTLLDERDPATKDYRYRGKVDLVYIDPPFMVNDDFRADNAIDIELDEDAHVEAKKAKKEPSLVEILAYKDTWRQGLDSFLSMLRARLTLLKDLLAPTGSIYVHLDWHAVHYVKVLMDELFGYENFQSEVIWKRASARAASGAVNHVHDTLLAYSAGPRPYFNSLKVPYDPEYIRSHYGNQDTRGRFRTVPLNAPGLSGGVTGQPWRGVMPPKGRHWSHVPEELDRFDALGMVKWTSTGTPELKKYIDEYDGIQINSIWDDVAPVNPQALERLGYPTQKPVAISERVVSASCPPGGLVLDCFAGSGTTLEAAERLGRRWIGIDNGKYAIHLARKRLIQLHGQKRPAEKKHEYVECKECKNIDRKERAQKSREVFHVRPFTTENMGVYQRAEQWQDFQTQRSRYRDEMIKVFGGEVVNHSTLLHGRKGNGWVHVGPLDGPISVAQVWSIAREAQRTDRKAVTVLSADFDTLSGSEKDEIKVATGVTVTVRAIPQSAIDEVKRRLELLRANPDMPVESMAIPAFYAPLSIVLTRHVSGRLAKLTLERCEIDIESFLASQQPILKPIVPNMNAAAMKKAKVEIAKWDARKQELEKWLAKATSWQKFIDFWAVDWDYGGRVGADEKPIFETDWQSFRVRKAKGEVEPLVFTAEYRYEEPGHYRVAARVTDVFGNDGIATVTVEVK